MQSPSPIATTRLRTAQRLLVLLVAVLGMVVATTAVASASTVSQLARSSGPAALPVSETRVGVARFAAPLFVGLQQTVSPGHVEQMCPRFLQTVSGSCVATNTAGGVPSAAEAADLVRGAKPVGSALKGDAAHRAASFVVDDIASKGTVFRTVGGDGVARTLVQAPGELNGVAGRFEWIVDRSGNLTHQMFVKGGSINGVPIKP